MRRLTEEFCAAKWEKDTMILPIGPALCRNAQSVARASFTRVELVRGSTAPEGQVAAELVPNLAAFERDRPAFISSTQTTSMLLTWSLNDRAGAPIWATTIAGEGRGPMGDPMSKTAGHEQIEHVLDDVFRKSLDEIATAGSIREFALRQRDAARR